MRFLNYISEDKTLEFPDVRQSTEFSCGAAAVQSVLRYYGIDYREGSLIKKLKTDDEGTLIANIIQFLEDKGLQASEYHGMSIDDLKKSIDDGNPVIIAVQAWGDEEDYDKSEENGHYVVAIGYEKDKIIFDDPSILSNRGYLTINDLKKRWHDYDSGMKKKLINYGIVVKGKKKYDSNKLEKIE